MLGEGRRDLTAQRHAVIVANPELSERELSKLADYSAAVATRSARTWRGRAAGDPGGRRRHDGAPRRPGTVGERTTTTGTSLRIMRAAMAELRAVTAGD